MALTGSADTDTSGTHVTLGSQALDYSQDVASEGRVREQEAPAEEVGPGASARPPGPGAEDQGPRRQPVTAQVLGGVLIAVIVVAAAAWYVPRIVAADARTFTGTVSSDGITDLNFANSGLVSKILVRPGMKVKAGEVLATETSAATTASVTADQAAIAADKAKVADLHAAADPALTIAAAQAQLAKDQAQLAADEAKVAATQIVAPLAGRWWPSTASRGRQSPPLASAATRPRPRTRAHAPAFSLLPQGPAPNMKSSSSISAQPLLSLRTSADWQVKMLVPESSISDIHRAQRDRVGARRRAERRPRLHPGATAYSGNHLHRRRLPGHRACPRPAARPRSAA